MSLRYSRRTFVTVLLPTLAVGLHACATVPSTPAPEADYVGAVPGSNAFLALQVGSADHVQAYLCDGEALDHWLRGTTGADGMLTLHGPDEATLVGSLNGAGVKGSLTLNGRSHPIALTPATGPAGLYEASELIDGETHEATWVVLPDGRERGQGRVQDRTPERKQARKLLPKGLAELIRARRRIKAMHVAEGR